MRKYMFLVIVSVGILSVQYHGIKRATYSTTTPRFLDLKTIPFLSLSNGIETYKKDMKYFWRGRIVSCYCGNIVCRMFGVAPGGSTIQQFATAIATYGVIWLSMALIVIIALSKRKYVFLFGFGLGLQYAWLPLAEYQYTPWDMPVLFFWTLVLLINETKHKKHILWIIPIGAAFKETIVVCSILILFWDEIPIKNRIKMFLSVSITGVLIKIFFSFVGGSENPLKNQSWHYENRCRTGEYWIIHKNINYLLKWKDFNHELFSICGLWLGIFLLPVHKKYKIIASVYLASIVGPCNLNEGRLWQELLPVFLVGFDRMKEKCYT